MVMIKYRLDFGTHTYEATNINRFKELLHKLFKHANAHAGQHTKIQRIVTYDDMEEFLKEMNK